MNRSLSRVKRLGIMLSLLAIVGCGVTKEEIDTCINICKPNDGMDSIHGDDCYCVNGVSITMQDNVIINNKSK